MSNLLGSSIIKKVVMSLSGLFLVVFLGVHLTINAFLLVGSEMYNEAAHFMATNPMIKIMEPVLAIGFVVHILYSIVLTIQNRKARPVRYASVNQKGLCSWESRNMFILGAMVLAFLALHIAHFWYKIKITHEVASVPGTEVHDTYALVVALLNQPLYSTIYVIAAVLLGFHLSHGFQSAFQSIGFSNDIWRKRLNVVSKIIAVVYAFGYSIIPIYFVVKALMA